MERADSRVEMQEYCERSYFAALVNVLVHRYFLVNSSEVHIDIFKMPPKEVLEKKLLQAIANAKEQLEQGDKQWRLKNY